MTMKGKPVFAANWKLNLGPAEAGRFMDVFLSGSSARSDRQLFFFPPALSLATVVEKCRERSDLIVGIQNIHAQSSGAYTGENSVAHAAEAGAGAVLVGHSERRHVFGETDEATGRKVRLALDAAMVPMLCVGETLEEREEGLAEAVVLRQLQAGLSLLKEEESEKLYLAYEPVWAIGTGKTATPQDASAIHSVIRSYLVEKFGESAKDIPICYGGSVNKGNVEELLSAKDVDGVLVGGASLDPEVWGHITGIDLRKH